MIQKIWVQQQSVESKEHNTKLNSQLSRSRFDAREAKSTQKRTFEDPE